MKTFICQVQQYAPAKFIYNEENVNVYEDELYTFIWNGVVYNETELVERARNKSMSQTEITIEQAIKLLFINEGVEFFSSVEGKFAFVISDKQNETLYAIRDHFGIEPLFYTEEND